VGLSQYKVLGALSESVSEHAKDDYRPLDQDARGFVVGEGAGFLVLEELEHAKNRGAKIYAELVGFGSSSRGGRTTAMTAALKDAGLRAPDLNYLQAAGIGLKDEDSSEQQAIFDVFNGSGKNLSVSASKAVTGFTGFSAGPLDLIVSTEALRRQTIPPVVNFIKAEKDWGFQIVKGQAFQKSMRYAMTNASGFNGQSVSAITRVYEGS
jgi:3-oxoacyl-[acyl-carrier-protein] synthase II